MRAESNIMQVVLHVQNKVWNFAVFLHFMLNGVVNNLSHAGHVLLVRRWNLQRVVALIVVVVIITCIVLIVLVASRIHLIIIIVVGVIVLEVLSEMDVCLLQIGLTMMRILVRWHILTSTRSKSFVAFVVIEIIIALMIASSISHLLVVLRIIVAILLVFALFESLVV